MTTFRVHYEGGTIDVDAKDTDAAKKSAAKALGVEKLIIKKVKVVRG